MKPNPGGGKCGKSFNSDERVKEAKIIDLYDSITKKRREKTGKKAKSEIAKLDPEDFGNTYGIDHLKMGEAKHNSY